MKNTARTLLLFSHFLFIRLGAVPAQTNDGPTVSAIGDAAAQTVSPPDNKHPGYLLKGGDNEFGFWAGYSPKAIACLGGLRRNEAADRQLFLAAFRYGRTLAANDSLALQYIFDGFPLVAASGVIAQRKTDQGVTSFQRHTAYGIGLTPVGLQLDFRNGSKIHPFLSINGGIFIFNKPMPTERSGDFAFIGESGGGVRVFTSDRRAVTLGLLFHHISNAGLQSTNRGLNHIIFYAAYSFFR